MGKAILKGLVLLICGQTTLLARPFIFYRGIVNAASFAPQGLPNGAIARGSIFSIFGRGLGPAGGASATTLPLANTLAGVSIEVCQGALCVPAIPLFVGAGQINAIMPSSAPLGAVNVRVTFNGEAGNFSPGSVSATGFGTFSIASSGFGPGIVTNFVSPEQPHVLNSSQATVKPGQVVTVWGTGLGPALNADNVAPQPGDLPVEVEIWVGGAPVTNKIYSGRSPCCAGLDQVVFEIPAGAPTGCYVPVTLRTARQVVSNSTTIAISADGGPCSDPANPLNAARPGGRIGVVMLNRFHTTAALPLNLNLDFTSDLTAAIFQNEPAGAWHFNRLYSLPPPGACTTFTAQGAGLTTELLADLVASGPRLAAGAQISTTGPLSAANAAPLPGARNFYGALLGTDFGLQPLMSLFFGGGSHRVRGPGGADVGAFQFDVTPPPQLTWTNRSSLSAVTRGSPVEVTWTGGDPQGLAVVLGFSRAPLTASGAGFACVERAPVGRLTIPGWVTSHLADGGSGEPDGMVAVVGLPAAATPFAAAGLDLGFGLFASGQIRGVDFR